MKKPVFLLMLLGQMLHAQSYLKLRTDLPSGANEQTLPRRQSLEAFLHHENLNLFGNMQHESLQDLYTRNDSFLSAGYTVFNIALLGGVYRFHESLSEINYQNEIQSITGGVSFRSDRFFLFAVSDANLNFMAKTSILFDLSLPVEFEISARRLMYEQISWSARTHVFVNHSYGFSAGFDQLTEKPLLASFYQFSDILQATAEVQFPSKRNPGTLVNFQVSFSWDTGVRKAEKTSLSQTKSGRTAFIHEEYKTKAETKPKNNLSQKKDVPSFATLVRWGLPPQEALKVTRSKDICAASVHAQEILSEKHWECFDK